MSTLFPLTGARPLQKLASDGPFPTYDTCLPAHTRPDETAAVTDTSSVVRPRPLPTAKTVRPCNKTGKAAQRVRLRMSPAMTPLPYDPPSKFGTRIDPVYTKPASILRGQTPSAPKNTRNTSWRVPLTPILDVVPLPMLHVDAARVLTARGLLSLRMRPKALKVAPPAAGTTVGVPFPFAIANSR